MAKQIHQAEQELGPTIHGYTLVNPDKFERAINGSIVDKGRVVGGIGKEASPEAILAEYDKLGGLIKKGKHRVKMGSFYDFKNRKPHDKPQVSFVFRDIEGDSIEIPEGEVIPAEVQVADMAAQNRSERAVKEASKKRGTKKAAPDDENEE